MTYWRVFIPYGPVGQNQVSFNVMLRGSSPSAVRRTLRQLQCLVEFIRMRHHAGVKVCYLQLTYLGESVSTLSIVMCQCVGLSMRLTQAIRNSWRYNIIDFPNLGSTYNGGWCMATRSDETLIARPSREVNVNREKVRCHGAVYLSSN